MKRLALFLLFAFAAPVSAQLPSDSVDITIYDTADLEVVISPDGYRGFPGDTITFTAVAIDTVSGDTIAADFLWSTDNPNAVQIDPQTGFATFNSSGQYRVFAEITSIVQLDMVFFGLPQGSSDYVMFSSESPLQLTVGETAHLCAIVVGVETFAGGQTSVTPRSKSEAMCPDFASPVPLPVEAVEWSSADPSIVCFMGDPGCPPGQMYQLGDR